MTTVTKNASTAAFSGTTVSVDHAAYVAQHDVVYRTPPESGNQAMPIGDGDLAAMVWCPPGELRIQINKSDLWWENPYRKAGRPADWRLLPAGALSIFTEPSPFSEVETFTQRLNLYHGLVSIDAASADATCHAHAWVPATAGVICLQYQDMLLRPSRRAIELSTWRNAHPFALGDTIGMIESLPTCRFAIACRVIGVDARAGFRDARTASFELPTTRSTQYTVLLAIAITEKDGDPLSAARAHLESAVRTGVTELSQDHRAHWKAFWSKSFLHLTSKDEKAQYLENLWYLNLYQMASSSRGVYAPPANGGLWLANRDERPGGAGYRHRALQALYWPLFAANHLELALPYFQAYERMVPEAERRTLERFGVRGAWLPEIFGRTGDEVSAPDAPPEPSYASGIEAAVPFWWCWQFSQDRGFLRKSVYPLLRSCVEFYRELTDDGQGITCAMRPALARTRRKPVQLTVRDVAALKWALAALIAASEELEVDEEQRPVWASFLHALKSFDTDEETGTWAQPPWGEPVRANMAPVFPFGLVGVYSPEYEQAVRTLLTTVESSGEGPGSIDPILAARLGLRDELEGLLGTWVERYQAYPQGFCASGGDANGPPALDPLGVLCMALNEMCVQGYDGLIRVFPAVPNGWDGVFMLRTAGGMSVMGERADGIVVWVALQSFVGGPCRLENPWTETARVLDGRHEVVRSDARIIEFAAERGHVYVVERLSRPLSKLLRVRLSGRHPQGPRRLGIRAIGL